jgi:DNA-binding protein H-NS
MTINLSAFSISELKTLQGEIVIEMELRQKEERQKLIQEFRDKAKNLGISLEELMSGQKVKARVTGKVAAKYVHPTDANLTWTGRGKRPHWISDWLDSGKSLDELKV